jgi:hypothetical protein
MGNGVAEINYGPELVPSTDAIKKHSETLQACSYDGVAAPAAGTARDCIASDGLPESVHRAAVKDMVQNKQTTEKLAQESEDPANRQAGETQEHALSRLFRQHIEEAAKEQADLKSNGQKAPLLGQMLVDKGYATQDQINEAVNKQNQLKAAGASSVPRIGDLMVDQLNQHANESLSAEFSKKL